MSDANTQTPTVPKLWSTLLTTAALKGGTLLAGALVAKGWLAPADQATDATQIAGVIVLVVTTALAYWRDRERVKNAQALAAAPPGMVKQ